MTDESYDDALRIAIDAPEKIAVTFLATTKGRRGGKVLAFIRDTPRGPLWHARVRNDPQGFRRLVDERVAAGREILLANVSEDEAQRALPFLVPGRVKESDTDWFCLLKDWPEHIPVEGLRADGRTISVETARAEWDAYIKSGRVARHVPLGAP